LIQPSVEERIEQYRPLIKSRARRWWRGWLAKLATVEDLEAVATEAVWRAVQTYRDDRGAKFGTYVHNLVDHELSKIAKHANRFKRRAVTTSLTTDTDDDIPVILVAPDSDPTERLDVHDARRVVRAAVDALPPRLIAIIERRYWRDETLSAIAVDYGLTRERIRQLESRALDLLRPQLEHLWFGTPRKAAA